MDERLLRIAFETRDFSRRETSRALAESALGLLARALAVPAGSFWLLEKARLVRTAVFGAAPLAESIPLPAPSATLLSRVLAQAEPVLVDEVAGCERDVAEWAGCATGPLLASSCCDSAGQSRAIVCVCGGSGTPFGVEERELTRVVAAHAAEALRGLERKEQLEGQFRDAQRMEAIGRLAGGVAHDFNNLLMAISGHTELLSRRIPQEHKRYIEQIRNATETAANLTRQLLAFSRKQAAEPQLVNLNELVTATHKLLRRIIGEDVRLELQLEPAAFPVRVDPTVIGQVLMNLAVNARDAMPRGGVLTISTANRGEETRSLAGAPAPACPCVCLSVADTGTGMSPQVRDHLFEPFFTTKEHGRGTGLGLSMVYGSVVQSEGQIDVESAPGQGTTFRLYFPAARPRIEPPVAGVAAGQELRGSETVLAVEDAHEVREVLQPMLEGLGYRVLVAADAEAALHLVRRHEGPIDLLLTDIVLPGISGAELGRLLSKGRPALRVLYASGYLDDTSQAQTLPKGAVLLRKPFRLEQLAAALRRVLDGTSG